MAAYWPGLWFLVWLATVEGASAACPQRCICDADMLGRKRVTCSQGGLQGSLVMLDAEPIDPDTKVFVVTAPPDNPNELTIGRTFMKFHNLVEIHVTQSLVPAIGDNTFWGLSELRVLNLTKNNITSLLESNFNGLTNLEKLHLDDNSIMSMPSAAFRHLENLRNLTLARNKIDKLVPLMFYQVPLLEHLDLSWNPITKVDENFKDIGQLRRLYLGHCRLEEVDSLTLRHLPRLEVLDLSYNQIKFVSPNNLESLHHLKALYLHGNQLTTILENTFFGHNLTVLTLSRNNIRSLLQESFSNLTVKALDLSHNQLNLRDPEFLQPVADTLLKLDISGNKVDPDKLSELVDHFPHLRDLSITNLKLVELDPHEIAFPKTLRKLNVSNNQLLKFPANLLTPLRSLEVLDLSNNKFHGLDHNLIEHIDAMPHLRVLHLHGNPWSCDLCYIPALLSWLNNSKHFEDACDNLHWQRCLKCDTPFNLSGRAIQFLDDEDLEPCELREVAMSAVAPQSHIGVMVACIVIVLLLVVVTLVLVLYYRRGADYYTHEEERDDDGIYENPGVDEENGDLLISKKPQIATIENMDEFKDDYKQIPAPGTVVC